MNEDVAWYRVEVQTSLSRSTVRVVDSIPALASEVAAWVRSWPRN
jgi:hypothetical protein